MTVLNKEVTANYVPAAAVKRRSQALSGITGCKGSAGGKTKKDAIRCLKRYIAREAYRALAQDMEALGMS